MIKKISLIWKQGKVKKCEGWTKPNPEYTCQNCNILYLNMQNIFLKLIWQNISLIILLKTFFYFNIFRDCRKQIKVASENEKVFLRRFYVRKSKENFIRIILSILVLVIFFYIKHHLRLNNAKDDWKRIPNKSVKKLFY